MTTVQILRYLTEYGPVAVLGGVFLDSFGLPAVAEIVVIGAIGASAGSLPSIAVIVALSAVAAIAADHLAYVIGRFGLRRAAASLVPRRHLLMAGYISERFGGRVVAFTRVLPGVRSEVAFAAGATRLRWRRFALFEGLGVILWLTLVVLAGRLLGPAGRQLLANVNSATFVFAAVVIAAAAARISHWWLRRSAARSRGGCRCHARGRF